MIRTDIVMNDSMRRVVGDYLGLLLIILVFPLKLISDILAYLYNIPVPSATIIAFPVLLLALLFFPIRINQLNKYPKIILICFFSFFIISVCLNFILYHTSKFNLVVFNLFLSSFFMYFLLFYSGLYYLKFKKIVDQCFCFTLCVVTGVVLYTQFFLKDVWAQLNEYGAYLRIADVYSIILLLIIPVIKSNFLKFGLLILGALTLLYIGSRSSLVFFLAAVFIFYAYSLISLKIKTTSIFSLIVLVFSLIIVVGNLSEKYSFYESFSDTRIGYTVESSSSGDDARTIFLNLGLERISVNPFTGNLYTRLKEEEGGGNYIHNILFLLDDYGLFVFLPILFLIFWTLIKSFKEKECFFLLMPLIFCLLSMVFSRAYAFPYFFFFLGVYINLGSKNKFCDKIYYKK